MTVGGVMDAVLWPSCVGLGLVFAVAGAAKLRAPRQAADSLVQFGVPPALASGVRVVLPIAELAVAVTLLIPRSAAVGAVAATGLLTVFSVVVAIALARGRRPACNCFGSLGTDQIGTRTLVRNGLLIGLASLIAIAGAGHPERLGWGRFASTFDADGRTALAGGALLVALVVLQAWMLIKLMRRNGELLLRIDELEDVSGHDTVSRSMGLAPGSEAPDFRLGGVHGEMITLESLLAPERPVLLMFTDDGCGPCATLMPDVARWQQERASIVTIALITRGSSAVSRAKAAEHGLVNVLVQADREVADAYRSPGTPSAVLIGADGLIHHDIARGVDAIRTLVDALPDTTTTDYAPHMSGNQMARDTFDEAYNQTMGLGERR